MSKPSARSNHRTTLPQSALTGCQLPQRGSRERLRGLLPFNRVLAKPQRYGRFSSPLRNSKDFGFYHSSGDTPSASLRSAAPSEREPGTVAGGFCHSTGYSLNRGVTGDFHRPYETQKPFPFTIHRGTLPQLRCAQQFPQRGSREGFCHSTRRPETARLRAIFIAPTKCAFQPPQQNRPPGVFRRALQFSCRGSGCS